MKSQIINVNNPIPIPSPKGKGVQNPPLRGGQGGVILFVLLFLISYFLSPVAVSAAILQRPPTYNSGLVGYWTMDGTDTNWGSNTMTDRSGNSNTGTMTNMSTSTSPTPGKIGQALKFDGNNDYINLGRMSSTESATQLTWSFWAYPRSLVNNSFFLSKYDQGNTGNWGFNMYTGGSCTSGNQFGARIPSTDGGSDGLACGASGSVVANVWTHYIVVFDGTQTGNSNRLKVYMNGDLLSMDYSLAGTIPAATITTTQNASIGSNPQPKDYFNGIIDDVRLYNRALSASEIASLYRSGAAKLGVSAKTGGSLDSGLVGHWTFDGENTFWGSNTTRDSSGQGNTGTMTNMSTTTSPTPGKIGQGLMFDGGNDLVSLASDSISTNTVTVCAWIYPTVLNDDYHTIIGNGRFYFAADAANSRLTFTSNTALGPSISSTNSSLSLNTWKHACVVRSSTTGTIYIDGAFNATGSASTPVTGFGLAIGNHGQSLAYQFKGKIDDVRIYNRALSASEIKQLYNLGGDKIATTPSKTGGTLDSGLVGHWTFDGENTFWGSNTTRDSSGQGNTGTMTNMSTSTSPTPGKIGQALRFDGVDDHVLISSNPIGTGAFTASAWVYLRSGTNKGIFTVQTAGNVTVMQCIVIFSGALACDNENPNGSYATMSTTLPLNQWVHIAVVRKSTGTTMTLYLNGTRDGSEDQTIDPSPSANGTQLYISGRLGTEFWNGSIDDARIYNRALSASEIKQLYNMGR